MSYGPSLRRLYPNAATAYISPIINGQNAPGISTNSTFDLVVSQNAANAVNYNSIPNPFVFKLGNGEVQIINPTII
jgi:hypothetical protein